MSDSIIIVSDRIDIYHTSSTAFGVSSPPLRRDVQFYKYVAILCASIVSCEGQVNQAPKQKEDSTAVVSLETKQKKGRSKIDTTQFRIISQLPAIDFRYAASKVAPAVVHVNSSWKISDNQGELRPYDPFKDFFGDDWFKFFDPFRQRGPVQGSASGVIVTLMVTS